MYAVSCRFIVVKEAAEKMSVWAKLLNSLLAHDQI
jgi:hypothetical protein